MSNRTTIILMLAATAAFFGFMGYMKATEGERMERARAEGEARAEAAFAAAGGERAWTMKSVNEWCAANGKPPAYTDAEIEAAKGVR